MKDLAADELLKCRLHKILKEMEVSRIILLHRLKSRRFRRDPLQELALDMVLRRGGLISLRSSGKVIVEAFSSPCLPANTLKLLAPCSGVEKDCEESDAVYLRGVSDTWRKLLSYKPKPLFVIDLSLLSWHKHGSEFASLRRQIASSLGSIRKYLWDKHMVLTSIPKGLSTWLLKMMARSAVQLTSLSSTDYLSLNKYKKLIVLDPTADEEMKARDILEAEVFIIGGIVDKVPLPGSTSFITKSLSNLAEPRRLTLHGSTIGIPNRINLIIEAILAARYEYGGNIEKGLLRVLAKSDIVKKLFSLLLKASQGGRKPIDVNLYCELSKKLPITWEDFLKVAKMAKVKIEGEKPLEDKC